MRWRFAVLLAVALVAFSTGCQDRQFRLNAQPTETLSANDPKLAPYTQAPVAGASRSQAGLQALPTTGRVRLGHGTSNQVPGIWAATLEYGNGDLITKTVVFKKLGGRYLWAGEQDYRYGPHTYVARDITGHLYKTPEYLTVSYFPVGSKEATPGSSIIYRGTDAALLVRPLTLGDLPTVLDSWRVGQSPKLR